MTVIADILMAAGSFGAAIYCYVLATRLKKFSTLESGMGGAIAVLSAQVDDMTNALKAASNSAGEQVSGLAELTARAESAAARLELMIAALHDLPPPEMSQSVVSQSDVSQSDHSRSDLPQTDLPRSEAFAEAQVGRKLRVVRRRAMREIMEAAE